MGLLLIARFTLQEAMRRRLFLAMAILSVLVVGAFALLVGSVANQIGGVTSSDLIVRLQVLRFGIIIILPAIWLVYLLSSMLTVFLTIGMISGEIDGGTFTVIVPKPLRRAEIILGKWLGFALILGVYTAVMALLFMGIVAGFTGYWPPQAPAAIGMLELCMLALLGLTTLGGAFMPTAANGAVVFMLFVGAFISSIVQFAAPLAAPTQNHLVQNIATVISLIMPTDAIWHGASFYLLPTAVLDVLQGLSVNTIGNTPFTSSQPVAPALLIWVALYILVLPFLAILRFQRRDL